MPRWMQRSSSAVALPDAVLKSTTGSPQIRRPSGLAASSSPNAATCQVLRRNMGAPSRGERVPALGCHLLVDHLAREQRPGIPFDVDEAALGLLEHARLLRLENVLVLEQS